MPFDPEAMKAKLKKKAELKEKVKEGSMSKVESKIEYNKFKSSTDKYGICDPDTVAHWNLDDVD